MIKSDMKSRRLWLLDVRRSWTKLESPFPWLLVDLSISCLSGGRPREDFRKKKTLKVCLEFIMAPNALECDICCNTFSEDNCPRILPCSHAFCGPCIDGIIATQKKTCPTCREEFTATSADDLMINRSLLDVVKQLSTINIKSKALSRAPKGSFLGFTEEFMDKLTKKSIADFREAESEILGNFELLREVKDVLAGIETLNEMRESVIDTNKGVEGSMEKLQEIKLSNEKTLDIIDQNIKWLKNRMSLILQEDGKTQDEDVKQESVTDFTSTGPVMDKTDEEVLEESQQKIKRIKELIQENGRRRDDITMEILKMKSRLVNVTEEMQNLTRFAVKVNEGKQMVGLVKDKPTKQICWSHLEEGAMLPEGLPIKHEALMNGSSRRAFLDLAVEGTFLARIVIKVRDEGHLALHFLHLCGGSLGPSYANSQISSVDLKGHPGEHIRVNGYKGVGKSVMAINWNDEKGTKTAFKAGEVRGFFSNDKASEFFIVTRDRIYCPPTIISNPCVGFVAEGLDALRDAISRYPDIKAVRIVDCGLMFPQ